MTNDQTINLVFPEGQAKHAVIWLHGLGASSNDFPPVVTELGLDQNRPIQFVFPQAPNRPITINGGMVMPGWYDIKGVSIEDKQDALGMSESQATLESLIQEQVDRGVPSENIIIAGFSQGGAVVYHTGVRSQHRLAGMLTMSTYLPFANDVGNEKSDVNQATPIFASHGSLDQMVPIILGKTSAEKLSNLGYQVKWQSYAMEHNVVIEQLKDIGMWINSVFDAG